ncbi:hypothetical protein FS749_006735 [Ceratobasidium sp. UAMH 11750]|nr:hypothetical protein FS749_006735 [Ceratobasidium sp. UAMH 11750]
MGRKKGGKNPEGHRAGGARSGAGRPRKAGPLTLKASIRVHAHDPVLFVRRDAIHPALRELIDTPAHYLLRCTKCGHDDPACLLVPVSRPDPDLSNTNSATHSNFSRSTSPPVGMDHFEPVIPHLEPDVRHEAPVLFTPPPSVSPVQQHDPGQDVQMDESTVAHAKSLLMLSTPVQSAAQQPFDMQQPQQDSMSQSTHADLQNPSLMQSASHLEQSMTYDSTCHFANFLHPSQTPTEPYPDASQPPEYVYHPIPAQPDESYQNTPNATATATSSFPLDPTSPSQSQAQAQFHQSPTMYQSTDYDQQPSEFDQTTFYAQPYPPDLYIPHPPAPTMHPHPHRPTPIKPGPAAWRHAPHSSSLAPPVAAIISPHTVPVPVTLDPSGPVHFLPTGQHSQRRRRRCVICINAGRGEDADRCSGRGNRHLCPWYARHGSPDNIMDIRNPKDVRPPNANLS